MPAAMMGGRAAREAVPPPPCRHPGPSRARGRHVIPASLSAEPHGPGFARRHTNLRQIVSRAVATPTLRADSFARSATNLRQIVSRVAAHNLRADSFARSAIQPARRYPSLAMTVIGKARGISLSGLAARAGGRRGAPPGGCGAAGGSSGFDAMAAAMACSAGRSGRRSSAERSRRSRRIDMVRLLDGSSRVSVLKRRLLADEGLRRDGSVTLRRRPGSRGPTESPAEHPALVLHGSVRARAGMGGNRNGLPRVHAVVPARAAWRNSVKGCPMRLALLCLALPLLAAAAVLLLDPPQPPCPV